MDCTLHYLELGKLDREPESALERWAYYIKHAGEEDPIVDVLLKKHPPIEAAEERRRRFIADEGRRAVYQSREKARRDTLSLLNAARREGKLEGELEGELKGKREGKRETARELKLRGFPIAEIIDITKLSAEEIEGL